MTLLSAVLFHKCASNNHSLGFSACPINASPRDMLETTLQLMNLYSLLTRPPHHQSAPHPIAAAPPHTLKTPCSATANTIIYNLTHSDAVAEFSFADPSQSLRNPSALPSHSPPPYNYNNTPEFTPNFPKGIDYDPPPLQRSLAARARNPLIRLVTPLRSQAFPNETHPNPHEISRRT